jgi:late competence protein required for DNA uptake (superfamily II DNA/RNA helicase)
MLQTVRCPFCVLGDDFRPMVSHRDGTYVCDRCGHMTHPSDALYNCTCPKCVELQQVFKQRAS